MDGRKRGKIPYGYRIVNGVAEIDPAERERLMQYFDLYLSGESMSAAAGRVRLPFSKSTLPHLFQRKEYLGTDFYPALITKEKQEELIAEWQKRKGEKNRITKPPVAKGVRVYTDFKLVRARSYEEGNPVNCAAALYQRIRPKTKEWKEAPAGK